MVQVVTVEIYALLLYLWAHFEVLIDHQYFTNPRVKAKPNWKVSHYHIDYAK